MKIKNFTLEGKAITVQARLDFKTKKPVYDLMLKDAENLYALNKGDYSGVLDAIRDDLDELKHSYDIGRMFSCFRESWEEGDGDGIQLPAVAEE